MPVFHTKTIESILEPVAYQVSQLVILHEDAERRHNKQLATNANYGRNSGELSSPMPADLSQQVHAVSRAVDNLTRVGQDTIASCQDAVLAADLPSALTRVENAARHLESAARVLRSSAESAAHHAHARSLLIEGARGILQGTSSLLLCLDEAEVRKLVHACRTLRNYVDVVDVIERVDDLAKFVRDLSPALARVTRDVCARAAELTQRAHAHTLLTCVDQLRQLAPVLVSAMKVFLQIQIQAHEDSSDNCARQNRDYLVRRMRAEIDEMIRVLQLAAAEDDDDDEALLDVDSLTYMRRAFAAINANLQAARDFLDEPRAPVGGVGDKAARHVLAHAQRLASRAPQPHSSAISKRVRHIRTTLDSLCELRNASASQATTQPTTQDALARELRAQFRELCDACARAISAAEASNGAHVQPSARLATRVDEAHRWLHNLQLDDFGVGAHATAAIVDEARKLAADAPSSSLRAQIVERCERVDELVAKHRELGYRSARDSTRELEAHVRALQVFIRAALATRVVEDFAHASLLRDFAAFVVEPSTRSDEAEFAARAAALDAWATRATATARRVAANCAQNRRLAAQINARAQRVDELTGQVIAGARVARSTSGDNGACAEHFDALRAQLDRELTAMRAHVDEATDGAMFVRASREALRARHTRAELAISTRQVRSLVSASAETGRLATRVVQVARAEAANSEDEAFSARVEEQASRVEQLVPRALSNARLAATNINDISAQQPWRDAIVALDDSVAALGASLGASCDDSEQLLRALSATSPVAHSSAASQQQQQQQQQRRRTQTTTTTTTTTTNYATTRNNNANDAELRATSGSSGYDSKHVSPQHPANQSLSQSPAVSRAQLQSNPLAHKRKPQPTGWSREQNNGHEEDTDDKFPTLQPNQPIMMAAHELHEEVKQWSSKENEIIGAAKKIALLMARLSQLMRGGSGGELGSKKDLISCAHAIAEASQEVTRLAKEQAKLCTDRAMRTQILQVCERIPTMGTQLKILSTVKATMLGVRGNAEEDHEAMDMIVGNAQNLMQSIKETVRACEAASIKIRTDQGVRVSWIRRDPWYT